MNHDEQHEPDHTREGSPQSHTVVKDTRPPPIGRLPGPSRLQLFIGGMLLTALLLTTRFLAPSESGFGTHQQIGLPGCNFLLLTGMRCPTCGMTTSWAWLTRGNLVQSFKANAGGALAGLGVALVGPWMVLSAIKGAWFIREPHTWWLTGWLIAVAVATTLHWIANQV